MDDTKKLIEKYKRELMELSKTGEPARQTLPKNSAESAKKAPQVIGYADNSEVYEKFLSEVTGGENAKNEKRDAPEEAPQAPAQSAPEQPADIFADMDNTDSSDMDDGLIDSAEELFSNGAEESNAGKPDKPADNLPISGTDPDEQLTGRSFEDERASENEPNDDERNGSRTAPIDYPEITYENYEDFQSKNIGRGTIMFRVFAARQAYPVSGVRCTISKKFGGVSHEIVSLVTDRSGGTRPVALPAPSRELSQDSENDIQPFSLYDATVFKEGFAEVVLYDIPVFDGVQSVQRVSMIPVANYEITEEITEVPDADN